MYARAIETFEGPSIHFGYYGIGAFFHSFLRPLGLTPLQTLGCISQFFGGISVAGMYIFASLLTQNRVLSLLSAAILMFSGAFWIFSIHGEVYVPQLAFVLLSLICLWKRRPLLSSLWILVAISITPTSLLALIPASYLMYMQRFEKSDLVTFALPIVFVYAMVMLWKGPEVISIFSAAIYSPALFFEEFTYSGMAVNVFYRLASSYGRSFNLMSFFAIFGFVSLYKQNRKLWGLMLAFLLPFLAYLLNLGLFSPDHLIISFIPISLLGSFGILRSLNIMGIHSRPRSLAIVLLMILYLGISFSFSISHNRMYANEIERVIRLLSEEYRGNGVLIADAAFGISFWSLAEKERSECLFYGRPDLLLKDSDSAEQEVHDRLKKGFWICLAHIHDIEALPQLRSAIDERPIYYAERLDWPIGIVDIFRKFLIKLGFEKPVEYNPRAEAISEYLATSLDADVSLKKVIDSPLHPVYMMKPSNKSAKYFESK